MVIEEEKDYEIMPINEINDMKKEIKELKNSSIDKSVQDSVVRLNEHIKDLLEIFREATKEIREEEEMVEQTQKKINEIDTNINDLYEQNAKIAEAMIAVHDTVEEMKQMLTESSGIQNQPGPVNRVAPIPGSQPPIGPPGMPPGQMPPRPMPPPGIGPVPPQRQSFDNHSMGPIPTMAPPRRGEPIPPGIPPSGMPPTPRPPSDKKKKGFFV